MSTSTVSLSPTKRLFVEMLTRDIELEDAMLDLLDNSVDGALRVRGYDPNAERPYEGFWANLEFSADRFRIEDNCGGIGRDLREAAFRLGRIERISAADQLPTVGTYGIGMKRAIFKLGRDCTIESRTKRDGFRLQIPQSWFSDEKTWELPVADLAEIAQNTGTTITVRSLLPEVAEAFSGPTGFPDHFRSRVSQYYSILIDKGFEVKIENTPVTPLPITFKAADFGEVTARNSGIAPYIYEGEVEGVNVEVVIGFYSPFQPDPDEEPVKGKAEEAGWTIVCNDRVVLYKDKSILTGWGDGAPHYHPQFRQIAGVVLFSSRDPGLLPLTTTKRGIDAQSKVYLEIRRKMRDGLSKFTRYTNSLKKVSDAKREEVFQGTSNMELRALRSAKAQISPSLWRNDRGGKGRTLDLPLPRVAESTERRMIFSRPVEQIRRVARFLFDDSDVAPSDVAAETFDQAYQRTKRK
jgi:histidine kinase/DNA gyrase B/HSP90-like ATPase